MSMPTPIDNIPDYEKRIARHDAFLDCEIVDRVPVVITFGRKAPVRAHPKPHNMSLKERWTNTDYVVENALATVENTIYMGDSLPCVFPNLGPDLFSAFYGCKLHFEETTSYSVPALADWQDADHLQIDHENFYFRKIVEMTDALLSAGKGKFYTGLTDLHPGADAVAALRGPEELNLDMIECPEKVKRLVEKITDDYLDVFEVFHNRLGRADQPTSSWGNITSRYKWYFPSCDFSCMISSSMFEDVFLPGIVRECEFLQRSIYHLDGHGALRHLDTILDIGALSGVQWVSGAGHGSARDWIDVYKRCQSKGKAVQIFASCDDLEVLIDELRPEGVFLLMHGINDEDTANAVLRRVSEWT